MSAFDNTARRIARCSARMPDQPEYLVTLSRLMYHIQKRKQDRLNIVMKNHGLNAVTYTVLMVLYGSDKETQRASELAEACAEKPANLTRICNDLEQQGFIARCFGRQDRRSVQITLTSAGRKCVEKIAPDYWAILRQTYADISDQDLRKQEALLRQQLANLELAEKA